MSVRVMSWVWDHSRSEGTDRLVLLAIADAADHDETNTWPSIATLAAKCRLSERSAKWCVRSLVEAGELQPVADMLGCPVSHWTDADWWDDTGWFMDRRKAKAERRRAQRLRHAVFARDGHACRVCGSPDKLEVDHYIPLALGGATVMHNLWTLCRDHNRSKGGLDPDEWLAGVS